MKSPRFLLLVALSLGACGDPPVIEDAGARAAGQPTLPPSHPPVESTQPAEPATFSAEGTIRLEGVESFGERACLFVTVRSVAGPLWLMKQVPLAGQPVTDGACEVSFEIDASDTMPGMMAGPKPSGGLNLIASYTPSGFVDDQVAADPVPVADGDAGIAIELVVR